MNLRIARVVRVSIRIDTVGVRIRGCAKFLTFVLAGSATFSQRPPRMSSTENQLLTGAVKYVLYRYCSRSLSWYLVHVNKQCVRALSSDVTRTQTIFQDLEQRAISGGEFCEPICVDGAVGIIVGIFGDRCKEVPCPDVRSTELLVQYDASQQALDLFGAPVTVNASLYEAEVDTVLSQATSTISVLVERINFASSCYVLYLAFLVIFPAPFVVYR